MILKRAWRNLFTLIAILGLVLAIFPWATATLAQTAGEVDLAVELKAPMYAAPGEEFVVHIAYTNLGTATSPADTWVKATLPEDVEFVVAKNRDGGLMPPDSIAGNVLTWTVGELTPGICCQRILITLRVPDDLEEEIPLTTQAEIGSSAEDIDLTNNIFSITSTTCDLAGSTKQAQVARSEPGDVITYTITLRLQTATGQGERTVTLEDILPPPSQVRFMGWVGENAGDYDPMLHQLQWQGRVRSGEPLTLQYRLGVEGDVPPGTLLRNRARLTWVDGEMELEPVDVEVYLTEDDHIFGPEGGQWQHQSGLTIDVPANAVNQYTRFQFQPLFEVVPPDAPVGWRYARHAFELKAFQFGEIHQFAEPIRLTLQYQAGDVQGLDPNTLRLWYRSSSGEPWAMLGEPQMNQNGLISFTTDHFTEFALFVQYPYSLRLPLVSR